MNAATDTMEFGISVPTTALYRLYDDDGELLYVGITDSPGTRMAQHKAQKAWWGDVSRTTLTWYASRPDAREAELRAIREERPAHNVDGATKTASPAPAPPSPVPAPGVPLAALPGLVSRLTHLPPFPVAPERSFKEPWRNEWRSAAFMLRIFALKVFKEAEEMAIHMDALGFAPDLDAASAAVSSGNPAQSVYLNGRPAPST